MGGAYRQALQDMMDEINSRYIVKLLTNAPDPNEGHEHELLLNTFAVDEPRILLLKHVGSLLAFSFLSRNPFSVDFSPVFWKLLLSYELTKEDILLVDKKKFNDINNDARFYGKDGETALKQEVENYFSKYQKQIQAIRVGMDAVLDGKLDSIAYLPLDFIITRTCGMASYTVK